MTHVFYGKPLVFNEKNHCYYWDGQPLPSVTTIINRLSKPLLIQWAADMAVEHVRKCFEADASEFVVKPIQEVLEEARLAHQNIKEEAGDIGRLVHARARAMLDPKWVPNREVDSEIAKHPQAVKALRALQEWKSAHKIEPIGIERRVMSAKQLYAGTVDFVGRIEGKLGVLDFKTGNGVYDEAWWQTCGYVDALVEEQVLLGDSILSCGPVGGYPNVSRWIVHLSKKDGSFTVHERGEQDKPDFDVWRALVAADKALRKARKHPQPKRT
jgi:hypothetical protein